MSFTLIAHGSSAAWNPDSVTSSSIDSTGANLIVLGLSFYSFSSPAGTLTDSKSNTWAALTLYEEVGTTGASSKLYYCYAPTVGSGHTFTWSSTTTYPSIYVEAFSGSASSPFDVQNGATVINNINCQPGSVTPSVDNEIVVALAGFYTPNADLGSSVSVGSSFAITDQLTYVPSTSLGGALAYKIQTSAGTENPTWTGNIALNWAASIATFKAAAGGATLLQPYYYQILAGGPSV